MRTFVSTPIDNIAARWVILCLPVRGLNFLNIRRQRDCGVATKDQNALQKYEISR